jgi:RNase P/RNase MRP subunit POP5
MDLVYRRDNVKIFAFQLSMPNVGSWNGKWSGERDLYVKFRKLKNKELEQSKIEEGSYYYNFGDGWGANVNVRVVDGRERDRLARRSKGFAGYDWMIDSIIKHGKIISSDD